MFSRDNLITYLVTNLYDIPTTSSHVEIMKFAITDTFRAGRDFENVASVLESAADLLGVSG